MKRSNNSLLWQMLWLQISQICLIIMGEVRFRIFADLLLDTVVLFESS